MFKLVFRTLGAIWTSLAALFGGAPVANAELQGDPEAIAVANGMMEAMGGRDVWAAAYWIHAEEDSHAAIHRYARDFTAWHGLRTPASSYAVEGPEISYRQAWTEGGGWRVLNGEFAEFDDARLAGETAFWPRDIYTMYGRLASGDDGLRLISTGTRRFRIEDAETASALGEFYVSLEGGPILWSSGDRDTDVHFIFGPLKTFGDIRLPTWRAETNGRYRFRITDVTLYDALMPPVIFEPPAQ